MKSNDCMTGYTWCKYCQDCVPANSGCPDHMTPRAITLDQYEARAFYDMAVKLGIDPAYYDVEYQEAIQKLAEMIRTGEVVYSLAKDKEP